MTFAAASVHMSQWSSHPALFCFLSQFCCIWQPIAWLAQSHQKLAPWWVWVRLAEIPYSWIKRMSKVSSLLLLLIHVSLDRHTLVGWQWVDRRVHVSRACHSVRNFLLGVRLGRLPLPVSQEGDANQNLQPLAQNFRILCQFSCLQIALIEFVKKLTCVCAV